LPSVYDFVTWEPLLRVLRAAGPAPGGYLTGPAPGGYLAGQLEPGGWSLPLPHEFPPPGQEQLRAELDQAVRRILGALTDDGLEDIAFVAEPAPTGRTVLHLMTSSPAVDGGSGPYPGSLVLVEGAVPEPWRRLPDPVPGAVPAPSADPALLERTLRERLPGVIGATEAEIAAAEARLGVAFPDELKALYRVTRARWQDWDDATTVRVSEAMGLGLGLLSLEVLSLADPASRECEWQFAAQEAVATPPDAAVQGLVGSPGWITFAHDEYGDRYAVDLTPGPRGHLGQVITLSHEWNIGAVLVADSLTDLIVHRRISDEPTPEEEELAAVASISRGGLPSVEAAAHPGLEVLNIGDWKGEPLSLAPLIGLPRLRTLSVGYPGKLADPRQIAALTGLEFLELPPQDWRVLLDIGAVPPELSAAAIVHFGWHPLQIAALANEILGRWGRPLISQTAVEGR
jgi:cell wall assembly regulator SMI1